MDFDVLPKRISGRNVLIDISVPMLTDEQALKDACAEALQHVAEAMKGDVIHARRDMFAHNDTNWSVASYGFGYYDSKLVPFWRGGLIGSFDITGTPDWSQKEMAFTASYAPAIQNGGVPSELPAAWIWEKIEKPRGRMGEDEVADGYTYSIHPHPFTEFVAQTLRENLEGFGYLDQFASTFVSHFARYG